MVQMDLEMRVSFAEYSDLFSRVNGVRPDWQHAELDWNDSDVSEQEAIMEGLKRRIA